MIKINEIRIRYLALLSEEIISNIISIQYDKENDLYIIFYKVDKSE